MSNQPVIPYLEWEMLNNPISTTQVLDHANLPKGNKKIKIERDEDYNLKSTLTFEDPAFDRKECAAGCFLESFQINGASESGVVSYLLESSRIGSVSTCIDQYGISRIADLIFKVLRVKYSENGITRLSEWYLNGPTHFVFSGTSRRKVIRQYTTERFASGEKINSMDVSFHDESTCADLIFVKTSDFQFLICKVPEEIGPKWSSNIAVEYRSIWGRIPTNDERARIQEFLSFIFGTQLLQVGQTTFDKDENPVEAIVNNPWGGNAKSFCSRPELPPIQISSYPKGTAQNVITDLLPKYLELSEHLHLREALLNYWISCHMPAGTNMPILGAAIETIIGHWYKWKQSKSHGVYVESKAFASLLEDDFICIEKKLENSEFSKNILNNMRRANEFGIMERFRRFFEEIKLPLSENDWKAINQRHLFVHGHANFDEVDWLEVISHMRTLETLFNRIMLKLLGYTGVYIDRSTTGWADKSM